MRNILFLAAMLLSISSQAAFDDWFLHKSLRIDYFHTGDAISEMVSIDEFKSEKYWGGSLVNLIDTMRMGEYYFKAFDLVSSTLIFSKGYSTLFGEWQFTEEARHTRRSFSESILMPFPKKDIRIEIFSRSKKGDFERIFEYVVDVSSYFISPETKHVFPVHDVLINGDPSQEIDIAILPEGYTRAEMLKFKSDCEQFKVDFFSFSPFRQNRDKFNIRSVLAPSAESGTDIPGKNIWKSTLMNSGFYTFDSERYLMTNDFKSVRDLAANVPYDQIYILVNSNKYGGGSVFNLYSMSVNSHLSSSKIFVHEFGHGFAGLADEYSDGSTAFNNLYPLDIEPWEPNLTTLVNFGNKWKTLLSQDSKIPSDPDTAHPMKLGVYEGGGYVSKGMYRPVPDCLMRSFKGNEFCPVCQRAIQAMIDFQSH